MFVFLLFFIRINVAFQRPAVRIVWLCRPCQPACLSAQRKVFWSSIRSFVQCSVDCVNAVFASMHAIFMKSPTGKLYFHFELELLQQLLLLFTHAHTLSVLRGTVFTPPFETLLCASVCACVCSSASLIKCWNYLDSHNSFDITLLLSFSVCLLLCIVVFGIQCW